MDEEILDLRGLRCPLPALFAARALRRGAQAGVVTILADDPLAVIDIPHMCATDGHTVLEVAREGDFTRFVLRQGTS